jgi:hypothetical protein
MTALAVHYFILLYTKHQIKMKKNIILGVFALLCIAFITSCNKYEDGPKISLLTKKSRLANDWVIESATKTTTSGSSTDITSGFNGQVLTIEKDEKYSWTTSLGTDSGTWSLGEDKDDIRFLSSASGSTEVSYRILRLKSKELWWKYTDTNGDVYEMHFKQK